MSKSDDGGPAWPQPIAHFDKWTDRDGQEAITAHDQPCGGMSLRDYFAGQALIGMLANYRTGVEADGPDDTLHHSFNRELAIDKNHITGEFEGAKEIAHDAYLFADALLLARSCPGATP